MAKRFKTMSCKKETDTSNIYLHKKDEDKS